MDNERAVNLPLDKEELKKLLTGLEKQTGIHSMLNIVLHSGASIEDCLNIHLQNIDYKNDKITVYDKYISRPRIIRLPPRVMVLISKHQNGYEQPQMHLYEIQELTAMNRLYDLSRAKLGKAVSWSGIRRTWAVLAFENNIKFKDMVESSGASPEQLAKWSLYRKDNVGNDSGMDFLKDIYE